MYGPRADYSNNLSKLVKEALLTGKIRYYGSKVALREYIHVDDAALSSVDVMSKEFENQHLVFTGLQSMPVVEMLYMLAEIIGLGEDSVEVLQEPRSGHYARTPYTLEANVARKYVPKTHIDLAQGLAQVVRDIDRSLRTTN